MNDQGIRICETDNCPHCQKVVHFENTVVVEEAVYGTTDKPRMSVKHSFVLRPVDKPTGPIFGCLACPSCKGIVLIQLGGTLIWPEVCVHHVPEEVEQQFPELASDFREAALVFPKSRKASAALSRRCLQMILVERGEATPDINLNRQIGEVLMKDLPSEIADNLHAIREIGNIAAHANSNSVGEILEVEENEAEWLLEILEKLFDYYYVVPAADAARRNALREKLNDQRRGFRRDVDPQL